MLKTKGFYMKKVFYVAIVALIIFGFSSCKRCITCEAQGPGGNIFDTSPEFCGSRSARNDFESSYKSTFPSTVTVTCN